VIKGESGGILTVNTGVDLTNATGLKLNLKGECTRLVKVDSDGLVVGAVDLIVFPGTEEEQVYLAGQYVQYEIKAGDITVSGLWRCWLEFTDNGSNRISTPVIFADVQSVPC